VKPLPAVRPIQPVRIESDLAEIPAAKNMSAVIPAGIESDFPSAQATLRSELSLDDLRGEGSETIEDIADDNTGVAVEEQEQASGALRAENAHGTFVNLSGGGSLDIAKFQETGGQEQRPVQRGWVPFAADVFVTLAVVLGAIFFYRDRLAFPANSSAPTQNSTVVPQPLVFQSPSAVSGDAASSGTASATPTRNSATNPTTIEPQSNPAAGGPAAARPTAVPKQTARVTADMMQQTLEQHPVAPSRSESSGLNVAPSDDSAPAINSSISGSLTGIVSSNVPVLVAPSPRLEGPLKIGGNVKEPHLLTRVMPEYSLVAKEAGVQGDVIINTTIDQRGNVVNMQVVSGPQLLRGAALDALRRWKYQPSTLNGQPIAVQMLVTLKFSRR
jgi:protein TonB